jgi:hypothetical protein
MSEQMTTTNAGHSTGLTSPWHDSRVQALIQIMLLVGFAGLAALGKAWHPPQGIPGSSAIYWLAPLILGRALVRRDGGGLFMGLGMAVWGIPLGLNNTFGYNAAFYGITGLVLDIAARLPKVNIRLLSGALLCGLLAHMVKFGFIVTIAMTSSVTRHFMLFGLAKSAGLHAAFGIAAGIVAWVAIKGARQAGLLKP